jgi:hypothetical protein
MSLALGFSGIAQHLGLRRIARCTRTRRRVDRGTLRDGSQVARGAETSGVAAPGLQSIISHLLHQIPDC